MDDWLIGGAGIGWVGTEKVKNQEIQRDRITNENRKKISCKINGVENSGKLS